MTDQCWGLWGRLTVVLMLAACVAVGLRADQGEETIVPKPKVVFRMQKFGGYGPNGGKVVAEFTVTKEGDFRYDTLSGKLPAKEVAALIEQVEKADAGQIVEDAGAVAVEWYTAEGKKVEKIFHDPRTPARVQLLANLADLARKYDKKAQGKEKE